MGRPSAGVHVLQRGQGNRWHAWWADGNGKKVYRRVVDESGRPIPPETGKAVAQRYAQGMYGEWTGNPSFSAGKGITIGDLTARYVVVNSSHWSRRTCRRYESYLEDLEAFFGRSTPARRINSTHAEDFQLHLQNERKLENTTVNKVLEFASSVFTYAFQHEWISRNPFDLVRRLEEVPVRPSNPFSAQETRLLLSVAREQFSWFYPFLLTAAIAGPRRTELCNLDVQDYDAGRGVLILRERKSHKDAFEIALSPGLRNVVAESAAGRGPHEPLFRTRLNRRYSSNSLDVYAAPPKCYPGIWRRVLNAAGVRPRGIHNLRSSIVTGLVDEGYTIEQTTAIVANTPDVAKRHYLITKRLRQTELLEHVEQVLLGP